MVVVTTAAGFHGVLSWAALYGKNLVNIVVFNP